MDEKHPTQSQTGKENESAKQSPEMSQNAQSVQATRSANTAKGAKGADDAMAGIAAGANTRRILSKRWLYPAIYLGAAALIIGLMYVKSQTHNTSPVIAPVNDTGGNGAVTTQNQPGNTKQTTSNETGKQTGQTATSSYMWPVSTGVQPKVTMGFFPVTGTNQQRADALVHWHNAFYPHEGIDIKSTSGKPFDVAAAASGKVTQVQGYNPVTGATVEVTSADGNVETYQSLKTTSVKLGETVQEGEIIGTSGSDNFEASQGNHVYFAVEKNGAYVDPLSLLSR